MVTLYWFDAIQQEWSCDIHVLIAAETELQAWTLFAKQYCHETEKEHYDPKNWVITKEIAMESITPSILLTANKGD